MGSVTQNPVKLEKTSLAASKHKLDNLFTDTRIVLHANPYDEFHSESKRLPQSQNCVRALYIGRYMKLIVQERMGMNEHFLYTEQCEHKHISRFNCSYMDRHTNMFNYGLAKIHYLAARFYTRKIVNKLTIKLTNNYIHTADGEDAALPVTAGQGEYLPA